MQIVKNEQSLVSIVHRRMECYSEKKVFTFLQNGQDESGRLNYGQLFNNAHCIIDQALAGLKKGDRALIVLPSGLKFIETFFACLMRGVIAVPLYTPNSREESLNKIRSVMEDAEASIIISNRFYKKRLKASPYFSDSRIVDVEKLDFDRSLNPGDLVWPLRDDIAFLQYTSGSTGAPKGVKISHGNLLHNLINIKENFKHCNESMGVIWLPPYHDMGLIGGVLQPVFANFPVVLMPATAFIRKPVLWLEAIDKYKATTSGGPNFAYDLCANNISADDKSKLDLSSWRVAFNGAEPVKEDTINKFSDAFGSKGFSKSAFYMCYGLAEATLMVSGRHYGSGINKQKHLSCGYPVKGISIVIWDRRNKRKCKEKEEGEILIRGGSITDGYWNTSINPFVFVNGEKYLATGDKGYLKNGELYITGRIKDMVIVRGKNYMAEELEACVRNSHTAIRNNKLACFSVQNVTAESLIVAVELFRNQEKKIEAEKIAKQIKKDLSEVFGIDPFHILFLKPGQLPFTSSGKIIRFKCKRKYSEGSFLIEIEVKYSKKTETASRPFDFQIKVAADDSFHCLETEIKKIITQKLDAYYDDSRIDEDEPISNIGLNSLDLATLTSWLEETFDIRLPDVFLFKENTIVGISRLIAKWKFIHSLAKDLSPGERRMIFGSDYRPSDSGRRSPKPIDPSSYEFELFPEIIETKHKLAVFKAIDPPPYFSLVERLLTNTVYIGGREMINFSLNNYLGMSKDPKVVSEVKKAVDVYGTSASASRIIGGERTVHRELEKAISNFIGTEDALVFVGGNTTNVSTIGHLFNSEDLILYDELSHDSLMKGVLLSGADSLPFPHNDYHQLEKILIAKRSRYRRVLIFIEGVYSMDGDIPPLRPFLKLKKAHSALLMVDECLSFGVLGKSGRGICEYYGVSPLEIDLLMGGLSKALASCGGFITGSKAIVEYLRYTAPGFIFTTGISPANAMAGLASLKLLQEEPSRIAHLNYLCDYFRNKLKQLGFDTGISKDTPVIPVIIGEESRCVAVYRFLNETGVNVQPILYPGVPKNKARLRFFINYLHTTDQLDYTVAALSRAKKHFDV